MFVTNNESNDCEVIACHDLKDNGNLLVLSRSEYDELVKARFALHVLGSTLGKYGVDNRVATPILNAFGYMAKEERDDV